MGSGVAAQADAPATTVTTTVAAATPAAAAAVTDAAAWPSKMRVGHIPCGARGRPNYVCRPVDRILLVVAQKKVNGAARSSRRVLQVRQQPEDGNLCVPPVQQIARLHQHRIAAHPLVAAGVKDARHAERCPQSRNGAVNVTNRYDPPGGWEPPARSHRSACHRRSGGAVGQPTSNNSRGGEVRRATAIAAETGRDRRGVGGGNGRWWSRSDSGWRRYSVA